MKSPFEMTLEDCHDLIVGAVRSWMMRYGGDEHVLLSAAYTAFWSAYRTWNKQKGSSFQTWASYKVNMGIRSAARNEYHARLKAPPSVRLNFDVPGRVKFNLTNFTANLSKDAQIVIGLAIFPPPDIRADLIMSGSETRSIWRGTMKRFLRLQGWKKERTKKAFLEIQEALG